MSTLAFGGYDERYDKSFSQVLCCIFLMEEAHCLYWATQLTKNWLRISSTLRLFSQDHRRLS